MAGASRNSLLVSVTGWIIPLQHWYVEVLTHSISECNYLEIAFLERKLRLNKAIRVVPNPVDGSPYEKKRLGHRHTQREGYVLM